MNDQNESPFGNPKFLASIVLVFMFLWGWQYYVGKKYPQATAVTKAEKQETVAATQAIEKTPTTSEPGQLIENKKSENQEEKTFAYEDEQVKWSISSYGMGLNSFELKKYTDKEKKPVLYSTNEKLFSGDFPRRGRSPQPA